MWEDQTFDAVKSTALQDSRDLPGGRNLDTNYHYLKLEADADTKPTPNFGGFLDKVKRGQSAIGAEHAVPIILGAPPAPVTSYAVLVRIAGQVARHI